MNERELRFLTTSERLLPDCTRFPNLYLLKSLLIKLRRRLWGRFIDSESRLIWSADIVSDADGPAANVRNYLEHNTIRSIVAELAREHKIVRACEIGCGYGRVIMVLKEFADFVKGFEREPHLVENARRLLPDIEFECVESLTRIQESNPYDLVMTCAVLQHLTDEEASEVCAVMKRLAPLGHILCIEKTEAISTTARADDGARFISRARSVEAYEGLMRPYRLVTIRKRIVEPTYFNRHPGTCMVFASPALSKR